MEIDEGNSPGLEEIRNRIRELRQEIEAVSALDRAQRISRQSQISWYAQTQHEIRIARIDEIKKELAKLGRGMN